MDEAELVHAFRNKPIPGSGKDNTQQVVRDAAMGVAIAKCIISRIMAGKGKYAYAHPFPCRFCKYDKDFLDAVHNEYMAWSMWKYPDIEPEDCPNNVAAYMSLPPEEQTRLTAIAQGYVLDDNGKPIGGFSEKLEGRQRVRGGRSKDVQKETHPTKESVASGADPAVEEPKRSTRPDHRER